MTNQTAQKPVKAPTVPVEDRLRAAVAQAVSDRLKAARGA